MNQYLGTVFWSWNDDIQPQEVEEKIKEMSLQKIGGFFIHSRAGLKIPYMGKRFFECVEIAVQSAKRYGMDVWLYDEDGWPSGFAGGKVPALGKAYHAKKLCFGSALPLGDAVTLLAVYIKTKEGYQKIQNGSGDLYAYYESDPHYVDLLNEDVTTEFIKNTHEVYKEKLSAYFGNTVQGIFTDEPQLKTDMPWSESIPDAYFKHYKSDVFEELWQLSQSGDEENEFRYRYYKIVSKLYHENFVRKISEWCEKNGLKFTGHFPCEDSLCQQYEVAGGVMKHYEFMHQPGIDFLGRRLTSPVLLKQVQSVKNQLQKQQIISETFGCTGWNISFSQMLWIWSYQAVMGVNLPCYHLSAYSIKGCRKRDYPTFFSSQQVWWQQFHLLNWHIKNLNQANSEGKSVARVLVLNPVESMGLYSYYSLNQRKISNQYRMLIEGLQESQIDFDIGDSSILSRHASVEEGVLKVGACLYTHVIVPDMPSIERNVFELLKKWKAAGGSIVLTNHAPCRADGKRLQEVEEFFSEVTPIVQNRADLWRKYFEWILFRRNVKAISHCDNALLKGLLFNVRESQEFLQCMAFNKSADASLSGSLVFEGEGAVFVYDPEADRETQVTSRCYDKKTLCDLELNPMQSAIFRLRKTQRLKITQKELTAVNHLQFDKVELLNENVLTLDKASCKVQGKDYGVLSTLQIQDLIYSIAEQEGKEVNCEVDFTFYVKDFEKELFLAVEDECASSVCINGVDLKPKPSELYIEKGINKYDISKYYKKKTNHIVLSFNVQPIDLDYNVDEVCETEKNRFFYPVEVESVYLLGDFNVLTRTNLTQKSNYLSIAKPEFALAKQKEYDPKKDLTSQGLTFFRGKVKYTACFPYDCKEKEEVYLCFDQYHGVLVEVFVNNRQAGCFYSAGSKMNITRYLRKQNVVECVLYSSNRNLLGPHHHVSGEPNFVGVSIFKGKSGYEDSMMTTAERQDTSVEDYQFVPFGMEKITLKKYT